MVSNLIFSLREVEIKFGKKTIFQNLDLNLHKGDMIALVGKNGVGKSTLMKTINGEQEIDYGTIWNFPNLKVSYFNNSVNPSDTFFLFVAFWILASFVSLYLLYNFKKPGKQIFLYVFITSIILTLFGGPVASDPIFYIIDGLGMAVSGALLVMLYYTPISKKF